MKGIVVKVSNKDLASMLRMRSSYHQQRADEKSKELPKIKQAMEALTPQQRTLPAKHSNYHADQEGFVEQLEKDIRVHDAKAKRFSFLAERLVDEDYELSLQDCETMELIPVAY